ncbi:MAG: hypothetical protein EBT92_04325 [Planctomycetes bacterium]|nr:hypothetical protein [Planctomycetota bacterium]NBY01931.1 hypothetical protein [Planctomycetota bacterium]
MCRIIVIFFWALVALTPEQSAATEFEKKEIVNMYAQLRERSLRVLEKGLESEEFWPSMHAAEALTIAGKGKEVIASLKQKLPRETNDQKRCGLARELVRAGDQSALSVLFDVLNDSKSIGRIHAAESLFKLGQMGDGKSLTIAFEQKDIVQLRLYAAAALAKSGDKTAMAFLAQELNSNDKLVRNTVVFSLARLGAKSEVPKLLTLLDKETDMGARSNIANALAMLGDKKGCEDLGVYLGSQDAGIRTASAEHAGLASCTQYVDKLSKLLDDPILDVRVRASQSLIVLTNLNK